MDSASCQAFARLSFGWTPKKATLQSCISAISDVTWEQINQRLLQSAYKAKIERGEMLRVDSTVTESTIHAPSDSTLLWDSVRVLVRLMKRAEQLPRAPVLDWRNHQRMAKKRMRAICYTRGADKKARLYRDLIKATHNTLDHIAHARQLLAASGAVSSRDYMQWEAEVKHYRPLILKVIDQTETAYLSC